MEPVVYDFAINENGTFADLLSGRDALMPSGYYALTVPGLLRTDPRSLSELRRKELDKFGAACRTKPSPRLLNATTAPKRSTALPIRCYPAFTEATQRSSVRALTRSFRRRPLNWSTVAGRCSPNRFRLQRSNGRRC